MTPAGGDTIDPLAVERRFGTCAVDATGMLRLTAQLAGEDAASFAATFDHLSAPGRLPDPDDAQRPLAGVGDTRTSGQPGADALALMARAARAPGAGTRAGEPAHVVVHTTAEQLAWVPQATEVAAGGVPARLAPDLAGHVTDPGSAGLLPPGHAVCEQTGPLPPSVLQRIACQAVLDVVTLHAGEWALTMRHGVPWFTPPRWVDPTRTAVRNTVVQATARARGLGQQLWFEGLPGGRSAQTSIAQAAVRSTASYPRPV